MFADEQREDVQNNPDGPPSEPARRNEGLLDEVQAALAEHDRRSEMMTPDPATREQAQRRRDREQVARDEARRLRASGAGSDDER